MKRVCFTGAGKHGDLPMTREQWCSMANEMGWFPENQLTARTDVLVASTHTTTKAQKARERGIPVWDYADFLHEYARVMGHPQTNAAAEERERLAEEARQRIIAKKRALREKADREQAELDAMVDSNPLWGSF